MKIETVARGVAETGGFWLARSFIGFAVYSPGLSEFYNNLAWTYSCRSLSSDRPFANIEGACAAGGIEGGQEPKRNNEGRTNKTKKRNS